MNTVVLANLISLVGSLLMVSVGLIRSKKKLVAVQTVQFSIMGISNLMLGGVSGFISNIISIARNLFIFRWKLTAVWKAVFIAVQAAVSRAFNHEGLLCVIPVIAVASYTLVLDTENTVLLKGVILFDQAIWLVYDLLHMNYVAAFFDASSMVTAAVGIWDFHRQKSKKGASA